MLTMDTPIIDAGLSRRVVRILGKILDIRTATLRDLSILSPQQLWSQMGFGETSHREVCRLFVQIGTLREIPTLWSTIPFAGDEAATVKLIHQATDLHFSCNAALLPQKSRA